MAACAAIFVGLIYMNKQEAAAPTSTAKPTNHTFGEGKSGVTVIEYGDFECPACYNYFPVFAQLKEKYQEQVTFQFRHFPIVSSHPNAMVAHRAAEAAARQGKFWEMHDLLYERQQIWKSSKSPIQIFEGYAQELGLDIEKYKSDAASTAVYESIQADINAGKSVDVPGTPGFVINGKLIETPKSMEAFEALIEEAIKEKSTG